MGERLRSFGAAAFALLAVFLLGPAAAQETQRQVPTSRDEVMLSFAPVVAKAAPAVVNIYTKKVVRRRGPRSLFDDPMFRRFFGEGFEFGMPRERVENALGSGVIVRPDGLVVTNQHVIDGADEITVVLNDRRELPAELILEDESTDLAILRAETGGRDLPFLEFRDSEAVEVGDIVLAIGNPFGVGQTVTSGIVSALARTAAGKTDFSFFIQTDASINPGNSGGALVTLDGRVVGINTAIYSRSGGSIGIGFAIPSNMVRTVVASAESGRVERPWLGFIGQTVGSDLAEGFGLDRPGGVSVTNLYPDGPAVRAGLKRGDVVLTVDGRPVGDLRALNYRVATRPLGGSVTLEVWRGRETETLTMALERPPETPPREVTPVVGRTPLAGATLASLSPALAEELELPGQWQGLVVTEIARPSPAMRFGFRRGDIILAINGRDMRRIADMQAVQRAQPQRWLLVVKRDGRVSRLEFAS